MRRQQTAVRLIHAVLLLAAVQSLPAKSDIKSRLDALMSYGFKNSKALHNIKSPYDSKPEKGIRQSVKVGGDRIEKYYGDNDYHKGGDGVDETVMIIRPNGYTKETRKMSGGYGFKSSFGIKNKAHTIPVLEEELPSVVLPAKVPPTTKKTKEDTDDQPTDVEVITLNLNGNDTADSNVTDIILTDRADNSTIEVETAEFMDTDIPPVQEVGRMYANDIKSPTAFSFDWGSLFDGLFGSDDSNDGKEEEDDDFWSFSSAFSPSNWLSGFGLPQEKIEEPELEYMPEGAEKTVTFGDGDYRHGGDGVDVSVVEKIPGGQTQSRYVESHQELPNGNKQSGFSRSYSSSYSSTSDNGRLWPLASQGMRGWPKNQRQQQLGSGFGGFGGIVPFRRYFGW